jgi:hypothetical protein
MTLTKSGARISPGHAGRGASPRSQAHARTPPLYSRSRVDERECLLWLV